MDQQEPNKPQLPFNNLFLNSGLVHGRNEVWMYFFGILATVVGYLGFQLVFAMFLLVKLVNKGYTPEDIQKNEKLLTDPGITGIDRNLMLVFLMGMFVFGLFGLFVAVRRVHKKPILSIITAYRKFRYKRFFTAFAIWGSMVIILTIIGYLTEPEQFTIQFDAAKFFTLLVVCVILMPIQTGAEEIFIRGYLMQGLALIFKSGIAPLIVTSLLFGLLHMQNPEAVNYGWGIMFPYYAFFGFFLGFLALIDEGLELSWGIHLANNLISSLLITNPKGTLVTDAIFGVSEVDPAAELIAAVIMSSVTFIIFWLIYRWKNFNLILK
ncbi:MAG: abortive phage infection protein [Bacteroidetes bacterium]|jgi:membrane protease YdiL (CAAX protease family)|nr:abortive phage infection protein [Bacteroidota bacterium]